MKNKQSTALLLALILSSFSAVVSEGSCEQPMTEKEERIKARSNAVLCLFFMESLSFHFLLNYDNETLQSYWLCHNENFPQIIFAVVMDCVRNSTSGKVYEITEIILYRISDIYPILVKECLQLFMCLRDHFLRAVRCSLPCRSSSGASIRWEVPRP